MKKLFTFLIAMCSMGFIKANPIAPPPVISEFYLVDESHWYLELIFVKSFPFNLSNFDGCAITTSTGTYPFKSGIKIIPDSIIVITQNSMQTPLKINRNGDFIVLNCRSSDRLYFGNISGSQISAPKQGQSIVNYAYSCWRGDFVKEYHIVKDNHPTIGFNAFKPYDISPATSIGNFSGVVYNKMHNPVPEIYLGTYPNSPPHEACQGYFASIPSDLNGKFTTYEYSGRYRIKLYSKSWSVLCDSLINIEPESINYYEFTIDTLLTNVNSNSFKPAISLSCFPNPTTGETAFSFTIPEGGHYTKVLLKIYNSNGEMVRILPVNTNGSQSNYSVKWDGECYDNSPASGIYFCSLELDGQKAATQKIIIEK